MATIINNDWFVEAINDAVKARIKAVAQEEGEKAAAEVIRRIGHEVDSLALRVMKSYSLEQFTDRIVITVTKPEAD